MSYNPLDSLELAAQTQEGLPPIKNNNQSKTNTENNSETDNKTDKEVVDDNNSQQNEIVGDYNVVEDKNTSTNNNSVNDGKTSVSKIKKASAKVFVSQGDKLQSNICIGIWDWRAENGLRLAKQDFNRLTSKVIKDGKLNEKERALFDYSKKYIEQVESKRETISDTLQMSDDEKKEIAEYLDAYMEETGWKPSPAFMILSIIAITIGANMYTAFTSHSTYNPPV